MNKPQGAGIIFVNNNKEVLLLLRDNKPDIPFPNCWDIPGGHVESGETPGQAIVREMKEELSLDIGSFKLFEIIESENITDHIFWKRNDLKVDQIVLNEGQEIKFFSHSDINDIEIAFGFKKVLERFFTFISHID